MWVIYFFYILLLFQGSVNQFFVKGEGSILYTHNNGKLANDPKLACQNDSVHNLCVSSKVLIFVVE